MVKHEVSASGVDDAGGSSAKLPRQDDEVVTLTL